MSRRLVAALLALTVQPLWAQVYTYIDAEGNRAYTDQPRKGAQPVTLPTANRMAAPNAPVVPSATPRVAKPKHSAPLAAQYNLLRILAPEPEGTVSNGGGQVVVTVTSDPPLHAGDQYQLLLDDTPGDPSTSPVIALQNVERGAHRLAVRIIGSSGITREQTAPLTFYLQRTSLAQMRRVNPCKDGDWGVRAECPLSLKPTDD